MSEKTQNQQIKEAFFDELQDKKHDIENMEGSILRKYGWDAACDFPDCCWRWVKGIKGKTIAVSRCEALRIERELIEYTE